MLVSAAKMNPLTISDLIPLTTPDLVPLLLPTKLRVATTPTPPSVSIETAKSGFVSASVINTVLMLSHSSSKMPFSSITSSCRNARRRVHLASSGALWASFPRDLNPSSEQGRG
ncbi:hypothetical protein TrVE_jg3451 [Triparma verrucosa]|uniref:Uncharacterized protein n=1 Tax=Triparma verrucosa TaxID=1606542 RepID=A0A9W7ETI5_9STRA|nr:hypothetical protein TrVE_jg3451 [Triparma verrucosa]